jgi:glucose-6-phosphate 1-dehydrogenase
MPETNTPTIFLIFGITGDLAQRKLLPALYHLIKDGLVHDKTRIIGLTRQNTSADELMKTVELCVLETDKTCDPEALRKFHDILVMRQFDPSNTADYQSLKLHLDEIENEQEVCMNRLYYLSIPPKVFATVVANLGTYRRYRKVFRGIASLPHRPLSGQGNSPEHLDIPSS